MDKYIKFYRVESKISMCFGETDGIDIVIGKGAYNTVTPEGVLAEIMIDYEPRNHPEPSSDRMLGEWWSKTSVTVRDKHIFGFESINQLKRWFYDESRRSAAIEYGHIVVYEGDIDNMVFGARQCVANIHHLRKLGTIELNLI